MPAEVISISMEACTFQQAKDMERSSCWTPILICQTTRNTSVCKCSYKVHAVRQQSMLQEHYYGNKVNWPNYETTKLPLSVCHIMELKSSLSHKQPERLHIWVKYHPLQTHSFYIWPVLSWQPQQKVPYWLGAWRWLCGALASDPRLFGTLCSCSSQFKITQETTCQKIWHQIPPSVPSQRSQLSSHPGSL